MRKTVKRIVSILIASVSLFSVVACKNDSTDSDSSSEYIPELPTYGSDKEFAVAKTANGDAIMLTQDGTSEYSIVIPDEFSVYEDVAARELQTYLCESTGALLPIVKKSEVAEGQTKYIYIGGAVGKSTTITYAEYGEDDAYLDRDGESVYLTGASGYGHVNAVYEFLRHEIEWEAYAADEVSYDTVEDLPLLDFDDYKYETFSEFRQIKFGTLSGAANLYNATRMGAIQASHAGGTTLDGVLFGMWGHSIQGLGIEKEEKAGIEAAHGEELAAAVAAQLPARLEAKRAQFVEANGEEPDAEQIAKWEATITTEIRDETIQANSWYWFSSGQLCLSKPEIVNCMTNKVKEQLLRTPKVSYLVFGGKDAASLCECDYCKANLEKCGTYGGIFINFLNEVSKQLEEERFFEENPQVNANVILMSLNYKGYVWAPVDTDANGNVTKTYVTARDNVGVFLCPIDGCWSHSLDDPECELNVKQYENMKQWSTISDKMGVWLYYANYRNYFTFVNNWGGFRGWSRVLKECGVDYIFCDAIKNTKSTFTELRQYLISKYWTDPEYAEVDTLVNDFMVHYYKAASEEMLAFWEALRLHTTAQQAKSGITCTHCYDDKGEFQYQEKKWWSWETLNKLLEYVYAAYDAVDNSAMSDADKELIRHRILIEEVSLRYWKYTYHAAYYTEKELAEEVKFLRESCKKLPVEQESEYGEINF
jgi:hypothetical protein